MGKDFCFKLLTQEKMFLWFFFCLLVLSNNTVLHGTPSFSLGLHNKNSSTLSRRLSQSK